MLASPYPWSSRWYFGNYAGRRLSVRFLGFLWRSAQHSQHVKCTMVYPLCHTIRTVGLSCRPHAVHGRIATMASIPRPPRPCSRLALLDSKPPTNTPLHCQRTGRNGKPRSPPIRAPRRQNVHLSRHPLLCRFFDSQTNPHFHGTHDPSKPNGRQRPQLL